MRMLTLAAIAGAVVVGAVPAAQAPNPSGITFTKDVAPIFQKTCQNCHRPGSIAPMSLLTYEDARPWARSIKDRVERRSMPPWHVDKTVGIRKFKDDISLSDREIATIASWIDGRSEERRVGKECRSGWRAGQERERRAGTGL